MWSVPQLARDALLWFSVGGILSGDLGDKVSTSTEKDLRKGGAVHGDYTGQYRPQVHFSPPKGFMNDPNGLHVDANGTWHLYYQLYPYAATPGLQHWGHATSPDLYHWTNQPIAIYPPSKTEAIYSGSAVLDPNNTSGFFPDQTDGVVAFYTLDTPTKEVQAVGYSRDGGYTFTPYDGNPVLDVNSRDFRDPQVSRYDDHWVMVVAYAADAVIGFYTSVDLKEWKHSSNFSHTGLLVPAYECPNFVSVPIWDNGETTGEHVWMLWISGGGLPQYIPGEFDGYKFTPFDGGARLVDFAKDDYAGQFFSGTPSDEIVSIHWAQAAGDYASVVPTGKEGWRSAMSLPRRHYMTKTPKHGWRLLSTPYDLSPVRGASLFRSKQFANQATTIDYSHTSGALYFQANFSYPLDKPIDSSMAFEFTLSSKTSGESVRGGYHFVGDQAWLDRSNTKGYGQDDPKFIERFLSPQNERGWTILGVIDRSILEVFINDGMWSATMVFYAEEPLTQLEITAPGFSKHDTVSLDVWELKSVWQGESKEADAEK